MMLAIKNLGMTWSSCLTKVLVISLSGVKELKNGGVDLGFHTKEELKFIVGREKGRFIFV